MNSETLIGAIPEEYANNIERKIPFLTDERKEELGQLTTGMLSVHSEVLTHFPSEGNDFFFLPKYDEDLVNMHKSLDSDTVNDLITYWVNGDLSLQHLESDPRAIGSWLQTLSVVHTDVVNESLLAFDVDLNDIFFKDKLVRAYQLALLLDRTYNTTNELLDLESLDSLENNNLKQEIQKKAAIKLFNIGIKTRELFEIFNHMERHILVNGFDESSIPALKAALLDPDGIDSFSGANLTRQNLSIALTGAQIRSGQENNFTINKAKGLSNNTKQLYLQYFLSTKDKKNIKLNVNDRLLLSEKMRSSDLSSVLRFILISGQEIHPNSYLAQSLQESTLTNQDGATILIAALDTTNGDLSKLHPLILGAIERGSSGHNSITQKQAAQIYYTCMGLGIKIPNIARGYLSSVDPEDGEILAELFSWQMRRTESVYCIAEEYENDPAFTFLSLGIKALDPQLSAIWETEKYVDNQDVKNHLSWEILKKLFTNNGYFTRYFLSSSLVKNFPREISDIASLKGKLSGIVHPDIWGIISSADDDTLSNFIFTELPKQEVEMLGTIGSFTVPISKCIPSEIYSKFVNQQNEFSLRQQLSLLARGDKHRKKLAELKRVESSDKIRSILIPQMDKANVDLLTQIRLVHRNHMRKNEQVILSPSQASKLLNAPDLNHIDRLGGIFRSSSTMPVNITMANALVSCASYDEVPHLMEELVNKAEILFPKDAKNLDVDEESVFYFVSAFQNALALIHPFYECNGRSSEDLMYILWKRRPDLRGTIRYVSEKGSRDGDEVEKRMDIINRGGLTIVQSIGEALGLTTKESLDIENFTQMRQSIIDKLNQTPAEVTKSYLKLFDAVLLDSIEKILDINYLRNDLTTTQLAEHLKSCSPTYSLASGAVI